MSPAMAFLFSWPRKAAATLAPPAAARQAQVKSSSETEARTMPPMTGTSIISLADETWRGVSGEKLERACGGLWAEGARGGPPRKH